MLNLQELATLVHHYAPKGFVIFLLNKGYESIRASQTRDSSGVSLALILHPLYIPDFKKSSPPPLAFATSPSTLRLNLKLFAHTRRK